MGITLFSLFAILGVAFFTLWLSSPGEPAPLRDVEGRPIPDSLSERVIVDIGGDPQGIMIQSVDTSNPVLLFVHGGPGMPEFFLQKTHPTGLEQDFTVVWWEQRGAGISWSPDLEADELTVDRLILDTIEVADYLRDRFAQERIVLLGHSWGSFLGIQAAARAPDRFYAYVGMAQVSHQLRSEIMARNAMIAAFRERGDARMVSQLEAASVTTDEGMSKAYLRLRDTATHQLGGGKTRDMTSVITGVFLPVIRLSVYTVREKINLWRGRAWSRGILWEEILQTDLRERVNRLDIPVHFFVGAHDLTAMPALSRELFESLDAPEKQFHLFEQSAHSPTFEEPDRARVILREILAGVATK